MQIVVNITENHYKALMKMKEFSLGYYQRAIINGTVLPKGHGDLIDRDVAIEAMMFEMSGTGYQSSAMHVLKSEIYTPTIIEEDIGE